MDNKSFVSDFLNVRSIRAWKCTFYGRNCKKIIEEAPNKLILGPTINS